MGNRAQGNATRQLRLPGVMIISYGSGKAKT
jgi:hypothetical protein